MLAQCEREESLSTMQIEHVFATIEVYLAEGCVVLSLGVIILTKKLETLFFLA